MIDAAFGNWLAGFVDGEGSFYIRCSTSSAAGRYACRLSISLRADDAAILNEIRDRLGIGYMRPYVAPKGRRSQPHAEWAVQDKRGCLVLVDVFDVYPLRAKKARDFAIWREAVLEWASVRYVGPTRGHDWSRFHALKVRLEGGRRFEPVVPPAPETPQLELAVRWWESASGP